MNFYIFDIETTGFDPWSHDIIDLAVIRWSSNNAQESIGLSMKPLSDYWSEKAEKIHGIKQIDALNFPDSRVQSLKLLDWLKDDDGYFVCHSSGSNSKRLFDYKFIEALMGKHDLLFQWRKKLNFTRCISTIIKPKLAMQLWQMPKQNLKAWSKVLDKEFKHHNALEDAKMCLEVLKYQLNHGRKIRSLIDEEKENPGYWTDIRETCGSSNLELFGNAS